MHDIFLINNFFRSKAQPSFIRKLKFDLFLINIIKAHLHLVMVNDCSHLAILNQNLVAQHLCAFFICYPAGEDQQHRGEPCGHLLLGLMVPAMQEIHAQAY